MVAMVLYSVISKNRHLTLAIKSFIILLQSVCEGIKYRHMSLLMGLHTEGSFYKKNYFMRLFHKILSYIITHGASIWRDLFYKKKYLMRLSHKILFCFRVDLTESVGLTCCERLALN